ncbi:MAG: Mrp/NBP35 family ATP-binding protein [Bacteroidales bacterium]|nr:Mrp/NBP35 family ATP-binding protein [Bacteroidales bacterium]MDD2425677.1 Mrp/NBP35 family ATP-binding protein [Bacteroidales bacterium]MDD3989698.1 Mrp/NBP35 family ATP-binding protein [Bacteroidales bacterium]MDD4638241.1 Mrp/NBP35 family ATP-binding protein [Bacteroidales bacterium]
MDIKRVEEALRGVIHPVKEQDVISLNMIEDIKTEGGVIKFKLVFPSPDPLSSSVKKSCEKAILDAFPGENPVIRIMELVRERKITKRLNLELGQEQIADVGHIIAVSSTKGGVGKSTVAVNLAVALAREGFRVGLADADVYGPSVPKMTATEGEMPMVDNTSGQEIIVPVEKFGIKWMSIGYFVQPGQPLIWRGPMASNALKQMVLQVKWGELDFLLIDLPPGTGDIHISVVQDIPISGAIVVTTPQEVALADVEKGMNMFKNKDISKPVIGVVENMSWFTPAELPENKYYIFGKGGGQKLSEKFGIPLLAQIPIVLSIRENGDNGTPAAMKEGEGREAFRALAGKIIEIYR